MHTKALLTKMFKSIGVNQDVNRTTVMNASEPAATQTAQPACSSDRTVTTIPPQNMDFTRAGTAPQQRERTYLVIDISGSMKDQYDGTTTKIEAAGLAAQTFVLEKYGIDQTDLVGVIIFDHNADILMPPQPLDTCKPELLKAVRNLSIRGGTDLGNAMQTAVSALSSKIAGVTDRIVLLTDGEGGDPRIAAESFKQNGGIVDCIGIGSKPSCVNEKLLRQTASVVDGQIRYTFVSDMQMLNTTFTRLSAKTQVG